MSSHPTPIPETTPNWAAGLRRRIPFYILGAVLLAIIAGVLAFLYLDRIRHESLPTLSAVVAVHELRPGIEIVEGMVELRPVPEGVLPADALQQVGEALGRIPAGPISANEILQVSNFVGEAGAGLSAQLPDGRWAMVLPAGWLTSPLPNLQRGDRLDLMAYLPGQPIEEAGVIVSAVEILANSWRASKPRPAHPGHITRGCNSSALLQDQRVLDHRVITPAEFVEPNADPGYPLRQGWCRQLAAGDESRLCVRARNATAALLDIHPGTGVADLLLNLTPRQSWADLLPVAHEIQPRHFELGRTSHASGLELYAAPDTAELEHPIEALLDVIQGLSKRVAWVILDLPVGWNQFSSLALPLVRKALLVTTADPIALRATRRLIEHVPEEARARTGLVINQFTRHHPIKPRLLADALDIELLATLPTDVRAVGSQVNFGQASVLDPRSAYGRGVTALAGRLSQSLENISTSQGILSG